MTAPWALCQVFELSLFRDILLAFVDVSARLVRSLEDPVSGKLQHRHGWDWQPLGSSGHGSIRRTLRKDAGPEWTLSWECKAEESHWA